ncbi:hypothetical protein BH09GEM1_BH09GEM1_04360 [soil metagenome]
MSNAEERVSKFYNTVGWTETDAVTEDARLWEDLRKSARSYVSNCRLRVTRHVGAGDRILDMASGPIQYPEYLSYSASFAKRYCVDLSAAALREAERKIGDHGVYLHGSFFDLDIEDDFFDCTVSLHTIYHIDMDRQEEAVRKLLRVTKPGRHVIIVYSNPNTITSYLRGVVRWAKRALGGGRSDGAPLDGGSGIYFSAHPLGWFERFGNVADVQLLPWRSFGAPVQKRLFPDNWLGERMLAVLFRLEDAFPHFFVRFGQYPMIVLTKRPPA